jgi:hypothetical protein
MSVLSELSILPLGLALVNSVYLLFHPLKGSGLPATFTRNVDSGGRLFAEVDLPLPLSPTTKILVAPINKNY